jgi:hypothetical protein
MMSSQGKKELLDTVRTRYRSATRAQKSAQLEQLVAITGYHRKYLIHLLSHPSEATECLKRRRKRVYTLQVQAALVQVWRAANCICAKRLVPCIEEFVSALERHGELQLDAQTRQLLLQISSATADRLLHRERTRTKPRGLSTTKPGTLLKRAIPIRTFADWDDKRPGFVEVDLVAHCNDSTGGEYLHTLVLTDVATAWTECMALPNRGQKAVQEAIQQLQQRLPFPLLGLDSDNGTEFINANLLRYCQDQGITFTRSRPYKKNDQAYVEQKNWTVVRQTVGYDRYEGPQAVERMQALYEVLRLYINFFQPVMKLQSKKRVGSRVARKYDMAQTPYRRVWQSPEIKVPTKIMLQQQYLSLNPAALLRQIQACQNDLWSLIKG